MKPYTPNTPGYDFSYGCDTARLCADINGAKISFPHIGDGGYTAHLWFGWNWNDVPEYYKSVPINIYAGENPYIWLKNYDCGSDLDTSYAINDDKNNRNGLYLNLKAGTDYLNTINEDPRVGAEIRVILFKAGETYAFLFEPWIYRSSTNNELTAEEKMKLGSQILDGREYWSKEEEMGYCHS